MKVLIVHANPSPQSFNHAMVEIAVKTCKNRGFQVQERDLYHPQFNCVLNAQDFESMAQGNIPADIAREQNLVQWADGLIFIYPIWWYDRPAVLKGWIDRVWLNGFAYQPLPGGLAKGLFGNKKAFVFQTTGTDKAHLKDVVDIIQKPMTFGTLEYCGISDVKIKTFFAVPTATEEERKNMLSETSELLEKW